tara:strand:+ start:26 stop:433 length:408 start_codon:yes stop_codon:yes gene_type:complete
MKTIFIVHSTVFEKIHYMLCMANTAAAIKNDVTIFFASNSIISILRGEGKNWSLLDTNCSLGAVEINNSFINQGIAGFEELLQSAINLKVNFHYCSMLESLIPKNPKFVDGLIITSQALSLVFSKENTNSRVLFI